MTFNQKVAMWAGIGASIVVMLYPAWDIGVGHYGRPEVIKYGFLFNPPHARGFNGTIDATGINLSSTLIWLGLVWLVAGGAILSYGKKKDDE